MKSTCLLCWYFPWFANSLGIQLPTDPLQLSNGLEALKIKKCEVYFVEPAETFFLIPYTRNELLHLYLGQTAEYLCQSQLCEQIASQTGCSVRQPGPALPHSSTEKTSVPQKRLRPRPRPASAVLDLWRPNPDRDLDSHYSEVGSLSRRRRRPATTVQHSLGQRGMASRARPCSVIETSVTRETQSTELHHRVRCQHRHSCKNSLKANI